MSNDQPFAIVLRNYMLRANLNTRQLWRRADVPWRTIQNWANGTRPRPNARHYLLKLAAILCRDASEVDTFLHAAGERPLIDLWRFAQSTQDQELKSDLEKWQKDIEWSATVTLTSLLPTDIASFVGRQQLIDRLIGALGAERHQAVYALVGMAGIGKTTLLIHLAHQVGRIFPDGILWADNLSDPMSVLQTFAAQFGHDLTPYSLERRSHIWQQILSTRHVLLLLDNVRAEEHIEPLLPPVGHSAVVITTQNRHLDFPSGIRFFDVEPFDPQRREALDLFAQHVPAERIRRDEEHFLALADLLGHLPLAVEIAAQRIAEDYEDTPLDIFVAQMQSEKRRLEALAKNPQSVRTSFNASFQMLSPDLQVLFSQLGAIGGEDFGIGAAATVAQRDSATTHHQLIQLRRLSLLQQNQAMRYRFHSLLRDFAREKLVDDQAAVRMIAYYIDYVKRHAEHFEELDVERANILGAFQAAHERALYPSLVTGLNRFYPYLEARGLYPTAEQYLQLARHAAEATHDDVGLAQTLFQLGRTERKRRNFRTAREYLSSGIPLAQQLNDTELWSATLWNLAGAEVDLGEYDSSEAHAMEATELARTPLNRGGALGIWSVVEIRRGNYDHAITLLEQSIAASREAGAIEYASAMIGNLGEVQMNRNNFPVAEKHFQEALQLAYQIGNLDRIASHHEYLGVLACFQDSYAKAEKHFAAGLEAAEQVASRESMSSIRAEWTRVLMARGEYTLAEAWLEQSMQMAQEIGLQQLIDNILEKQADVARLQGQWEKAERLYQECLALAHAIQTKGYIAPALLGLARVAEHRGDCVEAQRLGQESLAVYQEMNFFRVAAVKDWLDQLASRCTS